MIGDYMIFGGIAIIAVGFLLLILALVLSLRGRGGQVRKGAIIMMGPIPIILADDPQTAKSLMVLALLLMATSIVLILLSMVS